MDDIIEYLKGNIKFHRKRLIMTQEALAEKCGLSHNYIVDIELGRKCPSLKTLIKLSVALEIPVYMLLIDPENYENELIEKFSKDLENELIKLINTMKDRY